MSTERPAPNPDATPEPSSVSTASIERRRQLLRGLTAGAAAVGAGAPLSALAGGSEGRKKCYNKADPVTHDGKKKWIRNSVSGMQSAITSARAQDTVECVSYHRSYYKCETKPSGACKPVYNDGTRWKKDGDGAFCYGGRSGTVKCYSTDSYKKLIGQTTESGCNDDSYDKNDWSIGKHMRLLDSSSEHCTWITACLNASNVPDFSYDCKSIIEMHNYENGWDYSKREKAKQFFTNCQEDRMS